MPGYFQGPITRASDARAFLVVLRKWLIQDHVQISHTGIRDKESRSAIMAMRDTTTNECYSIEVKPITSVEYNRLNTQNHRGIPAAPPSPADRLIEDVRRFDEHHEFTPGGITGDVCATRSPYENKCGKYKHAACHD